jgi:hypothetical protein
VINSQSLVINYLLIYYLRINNNPSLIYIREINFNYIWERCHFNASINPILTNKEPEDKHKDEIKEIK